MKEVIQKEQIPDPRDPEAFYAVLPDELEEPYPYETAILQENDPDIEALFKELEGSRNYKTPAAKK